MFPFTPRHVSQARLYIREASKLLSYRKDIVSSEILQEVEAAILTLKQSLKIADKETIQKRMTELDQVCGKLQPPLRDGSWRENVEVFIVAISIALGVRTYFVQPFTIPTGSMQPTLNGIITEPTTEPPPNPLVRVIQFAMLGRSHFNVVAEKEETIQSVEPRYRFGIPLGLFNYSVIRTNEGSYSVSVPIASLAADSRCTPGRQVKPGDIIARGYSNTGDHVLVDKFSYHFFPPKRGNVFVFNTRGIPTRENIFHPGSPSQFYIKRLAGIPGDQLRVDPPSLFINGALAEEPVFKRVMAGTLNQPKDGYQGYSNGPEHSTFQNLTTPKSTFEIPSKAYFAMGDNSYHSSDSRDWGVVPERNVMGRGWIVYWPFSSHWGIVQ